MKTFQCNQCGHQLQRPTQPYACPQCKRQAVGLFKVVKAGSQAPRPGIPPVQGVAAPAPPGVPATPPIMPPPPAPPGVTPQSIPPAQQPPTQPVQQAPAPPPPAPVQPSPAPPPAAPPSPKPPSRPVPRQPPPPAPSPVEQTQPTPPAKEPPAKEPPAPPVSPPVEAAPKSAPKPERAKRRPTSRRRARPTRPATATPSATAESQGPAPARPKAKPAPAAAPEPPKAKPRPKQFVWSFPEQPPDEATSTPLRNAPAVDAAGQIYLHLQGKLVALQEQEKRPTVCWEYVTGNHAPGAVGVAADGTLRVHCGDGLLHCVSFEGKQIYAPVNVGQPLGYAAPVADNEGNTWISAFNGGLIKVDVEGRVPRRGRYFRSRQKFDSAGIIHQGVLYIGSEDGYLFAVRLDQRNGANLWDHAAGHGTTGWYIHCWPAMTDDGMPLVAGCDEHLYGFHPDGQLAWKTEMPGQMLGSPVVDEYGQIYVGISQSRRGREPRGVLVCVDGNSHQIRWQYQAAGAVESTPVIGDDEVIYFGDNAGVIHAVDFRGNARWTAELEAPVRSAGTILAPGRVAFGLDNETLVVLECSSQGLAESGWPKIGRTLGQSGMV